MFLSSLLIVGAFVTARQDVLLGRRDGHLFLLEGGKHRVIGGQGDIELVAQSSLGTIILAANRKLYTAPSFAKIKEKRLVATFEKHISAITLSSDGTYAATIDHSVPRVAFGNILDGQKWRVLGPLDFGEGYGRLPVTVLAMSGKGDRLALGVGPDLYVGKRLRDQSRPLALIGPVERVAAVGYIYAGPGDMERSAFKNLLWNADGDALVGFVSRVRGSGWQKAVLVSSAKPDQWDTWSVRAIEGQAFAWSPTGRLLACEDTPFSSYPSIVVRDAKSLTKTERYAHFSLVGWLRER